VLRRCPWHRGKPPSALAFAGAELTLTLRARTAPHPHWHNDTHRRTPPSTGPGRPRRRSQRSRARCPSSARSFIDCCACCRSCRGTRSCWSLAVLPRRTTDDVVWHAWHHLPRPVGWGGGASRAIDGASRWAQGYARVGSEIAVAPCGHPGGGEPVVVVAAAAATPPHLGAGSKGAQAGSDPLADLGEPPVRVCARPTAAGAG
jgi:hypothetical protein